MRRFIYTIYTVFGDLMEKSTIEKNFSYGFFCHSHKR